MQDLSFGAQLPGRLPEYCMSEHISSEIKAKATASSSFFSHTWITWHELKQSSWQADIYWEPAMKIMEILAGIYGDKNVRLVVWFED